MLKCFIFNHGWTHFMYDIERQRKILEILKDNKSHSVYELSDLLYASAATIRRDLTKMEQKGFITRTFGAVMLNPNPTNKESAFELREKINIVEKRALCQKAVSFLNDNISIFLDSSTTLLHIVPFLNGFKNVTVITNGLFIANEIITHTSCNLILCGGQVQANTNSILGPKAIADIRNFHADLALISCGGFDLDYGFSESTIDSAELKKTMCSNSDKTIVLADESKYKKKILYRSTTLSDIDVLITPVKFNEAEQARLDDFKITVIH